MQVTCEGWEPRFNLCRNANFAPIDPQCTHNMDVLVSCVSSESNFVFPIATDNTGYDLVDTKSGSIQVKTPRVLSKSLYQLQLSNFGVLFSATNFTFTYFDASVSSYKFLILIFCLKGN
jgi:hypothetical protein